ncbi:MAG: DNA-packaging protein [Sphingomonadaceae bacterium]|nr:DNA-packaging protein [Sphingomonadaceae bacterium]
MSRNSKAEWLLRLEPEARLEELARLTTRQRAAFTCRWQIWAREAQLPPSGSWQYWLIMAGRGFGKTRAGAEWVRAIAENDPAARIALVAASLGEARKVMVEGESGLLAIAPPRLRPRFEPSRQLVRWPNGAQARLYSAAEPESLRGPQHSHGCRPGAEGIYREPIAITGRPVAACRN